MKRRTILTTLALAILTGAVGCGGGSGASNDILATVEGDSITVDQFNTYLAVKPTARVMIQGQVVELPVADTLAFQAIQDLVSRTILTQMAKDENVYPTDKQVEDELKFQTDLDQNFLAAYQKKGMTIAQIKDEIRFSLLQEGLVTKGIKVTDEEVDSWLKRNPKAFVMPATVELSWVLATTDARKAQIDAALKSGKKFEDVAIELSQASSAPMLKGKYMPERGPLPITGMAPQLKTAIEATKEGAATDWIRFTEGIAKFHVDKKYAEKQMEITSARKENVRRNLALQRGNKANDLRSRLVDRVRTSEIVIRRESLKDAWKNFTEMLKKQAEQSGKQAAPTTSTSGGGTNMVPGAPGN
ncbi:MAG: SurA N-terminal domain-containing protein [Armatimonadetes bacterium]|nr:SurA N-terminal domain-containing protein [Armatimonadota bacterium]